MEWTRFGDEHPIRNLLRSPKYNLIEKYLREVKPETEKEWLERFSFENIYFHRVPGAPPLGEGPDIKINTSLPIRADYYYRASYRCSRYGISIDTTSIFYII